MTMLLPFIVYLPTINKEVIKKKDRTKGDTFWFARSNYSKLCGTKNNFVYNKGW